MAQSYAGGGFTDWFLPSKDELNELYINRVVIGGFTAGSYWASNEFASTQGWYQNFASNTVTGSNKTNPFSVRPIRTF